MKKIFYLVIPVIFVILIYSLKDSQVNNDAYAESVRETIEARINYLEFGENSPFNQDSIKFRRPEYFPIDPAYRVNGRLERITTPQRMTIQFSDGRSEIYQKFAYVSFHLKGKDHRLLILKQLGFGDIGKYFTGFADKSSTYTTYGGGRYLDLEIGKSDRVVIDFNLAYNPYCAYSSNASCALPPAENMLDVAIEAGEKDYQH